MTITEINRLVRLGRHLWFELSEEDQDNYCVDGTLTFIENLCILLKKEDILLDVELVNYLHGRIIFGYED